MPANPSPIPNRIPTHDTACQRTDARTPTAARACALNALARTVIDSLERSGKWSTWSAGEPRLAGFADLPEASAAWRQRRDPRCYQVIAGLTALGSRRGRDDDDAALAVTVLLEDGVRRVANQLRDVCEVDDVNAAVWEEVKVAEPELGCYAARYLLQRARRRLLRPAAGMVARFETTPLEEPAGDGRAPGQQHTGSGGRAIDRDLALAAPEIEDPVRDLVDLLSWAREVGVVAQEEVGLLVELLAAENDGMPREDAQRMVGERRGVAMRTVRRRRDQTTARLRAATPQYLAAIA